jgi:hypothetical protein
MTDEGPVLVTFQRHERRMISLGHLFLLSIACGRNEEVADESLFTGFSPFF